MSSDVPSHPRFGRYRPSQGPDPPDWFESTPATTRKLASDKARCLLALIKFRLCSVTRPRVVDCAGCSPSCPNSGVDRTQPLVAERSAGSHLRILATFVSPLLEPSFDGLSAIPHITAYPIAGWSMALVPPAVQRVNGDAQHFRDIRQRLQLVTGLKRHDHLLSWRRQVNPGL